MKCVQDSKHSHHDIRYKVHSKNIKLRCYFPIVCLVLALTRLYRFAGVLGLRLRRGYKNTFTMQSKTKTKHFQVNKPDPSDETKTKF